MRIALRAKTNIAGEKVRICVKLVSIKCDITVIIRMSISKIAISNNYNAPNCPSLKLSFSKSLHLENCDV